jgi:hypothetical protein
VDERGDGTLAGRKKIEIVDDEPAGRQDKVGHDRDRDQEDHRPGGGRRSSPRGDPAIDERPAIGPKEVQEVATRKTTPTAIGSQSR